MALSRESADALRAIIEMIAKYGRDRFWVDVGGESALPPGPERLDAFESGIQRIRAQAPSVLENLASMPKDPYYQALYGLAEMEGQRLGEAAIAQQRAIEDLAAYGRGNNVNPQQALSAATSYEQFLRAPELAAPPAPGEGPPEGPEPSKADQYKQLRELLTGPAKTAADLMNARANLMAVGDEEGAKAVDEWLTLLSEATRKALGVQDRGYPPRWANGETEDDEEEKAEENARFSRLEAVKRALRRFRNRR